jgi:hypothetical protein
MTNEYLHQLVKLIEAQGIHEDANLVITANDGEPAVVQARHGMNIQLFVENEDQSKLNLVHTISI